MFLLLSLLAPEPITKRIATEIVAPSDFQESQVDRSCLVDEGVSWHISRTDVFLRSHLASHLGSLKDRTPLE